jgi:hypothetical protein
MLLDLLPERPRVQSAEFLDADKVGAQAVLIFGEPLPTHASEVHQNRKNAIESGHILAATQLSMAGYEASGKFWEDDGSPFKNLSVDERIDVWTRGTNGYFTLLQERPEKAILQKIGINLDEPDPATAMRILFSTNGHADGDKFVSTVANSLSSREIKQNQGLLRELSKIFGVSNVEAAEMMFNAIKNARMEGFVERAAASGTDTAAFPGYEVIEGLRRNTKAGLERFQADQEATVNNPTRVMTAEYFVNLDSSPSSLTQELHNRMGIAPAGIYNFEVTPLAIGPVIRSLDEIKDNIRRLTWSVESVRGNDDKVVSLSGDIGRLLYGVKFDGLQLASDGRGGLAVLNPWVLRYSPFTRHREATDLMFRELGTILKEEVEDKIDVSDCKVEGLTIKGDKLVIKVKKG